MEPSVIFGQPSISLETEEVRLAVALKGGHLGPVEFRFGAESFKPLHVGPWVEEGLTDIPPILEVLRGDFFCMPFGANANPYGSECYPVHGETANATWTLIGQEPAQLRFKLNTLVRPTTVVKEISCRPGQHAIYQRHEVIGEGPMSFGHHAMLTFPEGVEGRISTSTFVYGQVYPFSFEVPAEGGYTSLQQGAHFSSLEEVPLATGGTTDLTRYPAREGFEDLVQVFADHRESLAWTACVFSNGYLWISLRNSRTLTGTVMWHSNGGRHYHPWNGRHRRVIGLEDVTSFFHTGLAESAVPNEANNSGLVTCLDLPLDIRTIMAAAQVPPGFDVVESVARTRTGVRLLSRSAITLDVQVDLDFLDLD